MSPRRRVDEARPSALSLGRRLASTLGREVRQERLRRRWSLKELATRAQLSLATVHRIEMGEATLLDTYARLAVALGTEPAFSLRTPRPAGQAPDADPVHAAMGEAEAAHLGALGFEVLLDEPYQHFQFAGRADLVAVDRDTRALLHLENRTRFPDLQAAIGSYNAKRAYLAPQLAGRLGIAGGFRTTTHVIVALWSAEALHTLRLREASFRSVCPDPASDFGTWWDGTPPEGNGQKSTLVLFDPLPGQRSTRRRWVGLGDLHTVEPRYRGYSDATAKLRLAHAA
jgi:transcriptional regulator with XRE-family HTH domain